MNNELDDFRSAIANVSVKREKNEFKLHQLKIEHYFWDSGDIEVNMPISTSIELTCKYDYKIEKLNWKKTISYTYLNKNNEKTTNTYTKELDNSEQIIKELEKNDLRDLQNNYFNEEGPKTFTRWELTYNKYFKIVGTYDREIEEFFRISRILSFKELIGEVSRKNFTKFTKLES